MGVTATGSPSSHCNHDAHKGGSAECYPLSNAPESEATSEERVVVEVLLQASCFAPRALRGRLRVDVIGHGSASSRDTLVHIWLVPTEI